MSDQNRGTEKNVIVYRQLKQEASRKLGGEIENSQGADRGCS